MWVCVWVIDIIWSLLLLCGTAIQLLNLKFNRTPNLHRHRASHVYLTRPSEWLQPDCFPLLLTKWDASWWYPLEASLTEQNEARHNFFFNRAPFISVGLKLILTPSGGPNGSEGSNKWWWRITRANGGRMATLLTLGLKDDVWETMEDGWVLWRRDINTTGDEFGGRWLSE